MKKKSIKGKTVTVVLSMLMIVSTVAYRGVVNAAATVNNTTTLETPLAVGDTFVANINNNGVVSLPCKFEVTKLAVGGAPGEVKVGSSAIDKGTIGTIEIPNTINHSTNTYTVTRIEGSAFSACNKLTSTGLENNTTVTSIGSNAFYDCINLTSTGLAGNVAVKTVDEFAFAQCVSLTSTGLEDNNTVISIGKSTFIRCFALKSTGLEKNSTLSSLGETVFAYCTGLTSTGLEKNTKISSLGSLVFTYCSNLISTGLESNTTVSVIKEQAFEYCGSLKSTGLENNTTVESVENNVFRNCTSLGNIIFKVTTLPTMDNSYGGIFADTNAKVYYLPETTNPEQLTGCGATVDILTVNDVAMKLKPTDTYIEGQSFNPNGLVLTVTYNSGTSEDIVYNEITKANFSFDKTVLALNDTEVTITYSGKIATLPITMVARKITEVQVKTPAAKVDYIEGQSFDPNGLILTVTYDSGISEDIVYNDTTKANFSFDKATLSLGDTEVTVKYKDQITVMPITVETKVVIDPIDPTSPTKPETTNGTTNETTTDLAVVTNDNTTSISGIVVLLLVTGLMSVLLIKRKSKHIE